MQDAFDATLDYLANVFIHKGPADNYGVSSQLQQVGANVPCRVSLGRGRAKEWFADQKFARNYREVFMRPFIDTDGNALSIHHWLTINSGPDGASQKYQIFQIDPPQGLKAPVHHLEVWCQLIIS